VRRPVAVPPGGHRLAETDHMLTVGVGAALCVCARDPDTGIGGVCHFLLPVEGAVRDAWSGTAAARAMRLGNLAVEHLLTDIHKRGGTRHRLEVAVVGGALVHEDTHGAARAGVEVMRRYLAIEGFRAVREEIGGNHARQIAFVPETGHLRVTAASPRRTHEIVAWELQAVRHPTPPLVMDIELF
jgi:chemotaxis protein CheD